MARITPDFPNYFVPWDPLKLTDKIDGGHRARRNLVNFPLFRAYRRKLFWSSMTDNGLGLYYGDYRQVTTMITNMIKYARKNFLGAMSINYYDFSGDRKTLLEPYMKDYFFKYVPYERKFPQFLRDLLEHRGKIRNMTQDVGRTEAPNKLIEIIMIDLSESMVEDLNKFKKAFLELLLNSSNERLHLFLLSEYAGNIDPEIIGSTSQNFFIGDENSDYVRNDLCADWKIKRNSIDQEVIGFGITGLEENYLTPIHNLKYTLSAWRKEYNEILDEEEELYRRFLEDLEG